VTAPVHPTYSPVLLAARDEAPGVRTFRFASWPGFTFIPGQFLMFHFADDPKTWRAYSLCSAPAAAKEYFEVTVGMVGDFSARLGALQPGREGRLVVRGPFGKWTWNGEGHAVLVSGGTGLTPFRAMALLGKGKATLCCSAKTPDGLLYKNEYEGWRKNGAIVHERVTQPGSGMKDSIGEGRWTADAVLAAANDAAAVYYLCGPKQLVSEMKSGLQGLGVTPKNIRTENWGDYTDLF